MTLDQYNQLQTRVDVLGRYLDVARRQIQLEEKEQLTLDPDFWSDSERAQSALKEIKSHKHWLYYFKEIKTVVDDLGVLLEFFDAGDTSEEELDAAYLCAVEIVDDVEFRSTLNQPEDEMSCILEINAGAGGTESCDWSEMLLRMYVMWGEKNGYKVSELNRVNGDVAGIKSAEVEISGDYAFGMLKGENGVHRLVRVSPFNAQGKRMTSFSSVFVHPLIDDSIQVDIKTDDLEWDTFRSSGAGGQHVNKTESAVRVRHLPSGIVVECQQERSQHQNREKALQVLRSRLYEKEIEKRNALRDKVESGKMKNEWGSQIRSYVLDDRRVKDHRSQYMVHNPDLVLNGDLNEFIKAYLMWSRSGDASQN
ncbi:MAG: peptide chain release factor 2 [Saprospiraceae bacterium]